MNNDVEYDEMASTYFFSFPIPECELIKLKWKFPKMEVLIWHNLAPKYNQ